MKLKEDVIFWVTVRNEKKLATLSNVSTNQDYKENLVEMNGKQHSIWNPYMSKLAAAIINGMEIFPILKKTKILYLDPTSEKTIKHISNVGGRFSSLTSTGLLPAVIMGADPYAIRESSQKTLDFILEDKNFRMLGSSLFIDKTINVKKLNCVISYGDFLAPMVRWYRQLWAESLGKNGQGNFFISAEGTKDNIASYKCG